MSIKRMQPDFGELGSPQPLMRSVMWLVPREALVKVRLFYKSLLQAQSRFKLLLTLTIPLLAWLFEQLRDFEFCPNMKLDFCNR